MTVENTRKQNINICKDCNELKPIHGYGLCMKCYYQFYHQQKQSKVELIQCKCDPKCPKMIPSINKLGQPAKYAKGHNGRGKPRLDMMGPNNINFKNYIKMDRDYEQIKAPNHPNSQKDGYGYKHRLIMSEMLGRPLEKHESVHHKNGNKKDNRPENLQLMTKSTHATHHHPVLDKSNTVCKLCDSKTTHIRKSGRIEWYTYEDGYICKKCYYSMKYREKKKKYSS